MKNARIGGDGPKKPPAKEAPMKAKSPAKKKC
jgi:hypothetical protein